MQARDKFIHDMSILPHVLVNLREGFVVFNLKRNKIFKRLDDPDYLRALNNGTLDRLLRSSEVTLDRKGFFPLPVKIIDFDLTESFQQAGIAQEYLDLARYLSKPNSEVTPVLNDLSYFIRAVKIDQLHARGWETQHVERVNERTGLVSYTVEKGFTDHIPSHIHFKDWIKNNIGIDYASEQDIHDLTNLTELQALFDVFPDEDRRKKPLRDEDLKILTKLLMAGYPIMLHSKKEAFIMTGAHLENLYAHHEGQRYFGTLRSLGSERLENNISMFKLRRDQNGRLQTKLNEIFQRDEAVVVQDIPANEEERIQFTNLKNILADQDKLKDKKVIFSCRVKDIRLHKASKSLYLKSGDNFIQIKPISKGFYDILKLKTSTAKRNYELRGDTAIRYNTPLLFKGTFKTIENNGLVVFENLESLSFRNRMQIIPNKE